MELQFEPRYGRKRRKTRLWPWGLLLVFLAGLALGTYGAFVKWLESLPSTERVAPDFGGNPKPVFLATSEMLELPAAGSGDSLMLPLETIQSQIDPFAYWEQESDSLIITTADKVIRFKTDQLTAWMNEQPFELSFPVQREEGRVYVPVQALLDFYPIELRESEETGAVFLLKDGDVIRWASVAKLPDDAEEKTVAMRAQASIKAPIAADLEPGRRLMIIEDHGDWFEVQLENGWIGFVPKSAVRLEEPEVIRHSPRPKPFVPWKPTGGKINLTWEQVTSRNPDTSAIGEMPGLNVISPTWFYLADDQGRIGNRADKSYVNWAHGRGYQVWALFSNDFDPDRTKKALSNYETRMYMIKQIIGFAEAYDLDGINIDFENVYLEDKDKMTQFVREMTPLLHEQGLVVSIDVTVRGGSPMWSLFLDREALGQTVDYMIVMTYDEHWASSPKAGSVASLPWTEKGIVDIMREDKVPASKLVLGIPYYTREWTETVVNGQVKVTSRAFGMTTAGNIIRERNLTPVFDESAGQDYVEYKADGATKKIWLENAKSIRARVEIVRKYDLAGVASWRRGFETPDIWTAIKETLEKRP